jgi:hypothetical protein
MSPTDAEVIEVLRVTARRCRRSERSLPAEKRSFELPNGRTNVEAILSYLKSTNAVVSFAATPEERAIAGFFETVGEAKQSELLCIARWGYPFPQ